MVDKKNKNDDDLEVLVRVPPSDSELFAGAFCGFDKINEPVRMTMKEYKDYKSFSNLCLAGIIIVGGIAFYQDAQKYGGIIKYLQYQSDLLNKVPPLP
jgi:hypothetical protein